MPRQKHQCRECSASFSKYMDAQVHEDNTGHDTYEAPPEGASDRELQARGFDPKPEPTEGHVSVVDGQRVGRRRADY